jgi:hypothetical protein
MELSSFHLKHWNRESHGPKQFDRANTLRCLDEAWSGQGEGRVPTEQQTRGQGDAPHPCPESQAETQHEKQIYKNGPDMTGGFKSDGRASLLYQIELLRRHLERLSDLYSYV